MQFVDETKAAELMAEAKPTLATHIIRVPKGAAVEIVLQNNR